MRFKKTVLPNGIRVVSELHPSSRAVSLGVWVLTGTRHENTKQAGMSHFLEHLVFKGTKTRSAYQIAKSLEALGGELNAYTSREHTCYYALVLKDHWEKGMEVLADLVTNMKVSRENFILEKSVILQEIGMSDENLEELIYDYYFERSLPKSSLGKPILGTEASISQTTMKSVTEFYKENYSGSHLIVSATGNIDHQDLVEAVQKYLGKKPKGRPLVKNKKPKHKAIRAVIEKPSEQLHLLFGFPVTSFKDRLRFEAFIVNALLGGGMTSKLFQSVREKRGLVYSIYSTLNTFTDYGCINIYAACDQKNVKSVFKNVGAELRRLKKYKISHHDLQMYKTQVKGALLLGSDDIDNRMNSIAVNEMIFEKYKSIDEVIAEIDQVSTKSVKEFIDKYLDQNAVSCILLGKGASELKDWFEKSEL